MTGRGIGFRKVIFFNEHFVVYGIPAIASSIDSRIEAVVERVDDARDVSGPSSGLLRGDGWVLEDARLAGTGRRVEEFHEAEPLLLVFEALGLDPAEENLKITVTGDLETAGGIGSSAAFCVSVARALSDEFGLGLGDDAINRVAYEGEKAYAGTPSGIDNTVSTYGGMIYFVKNMSGGENRIERLDIESPIRIVMGNTGIPGKTRVSVSGVRRRREERPEEYSRIFEESRELIREAAAALKGHDLEEIGRLMDRNHELLQRIDVSHPMLDELVEIAMDNGALGAKMTGGGLGGHMIALTPLEESQERVATAMREAGFEATPTMIGVSSTKAEDRLDE
jgi:mevalonate kinase